jgi:hypothetical protein
MSISKLSPRFARGRVLGLVVAMLASRRANDHEDCNGEDGNEHRPFHPDRLALVHKQPGEQIDDGNSQAVDGVKEHTEKDEDLEELVLVDTVQKAPDVPTQKRCQNVHRDENRHAHAAYAVQDKGQHGPLAPVPQGSAQANVPFQAHLGLLERFEVLKIAGAPIHLSILKGDNTHGLIVSDFL